MVSLYPMGRKEVTSPSERPRDGSRKVAHMRFKAASQTGSSAFSASRARRRLPVATHPITRPEPLYDGKRPGRTERAPLRHSAPAITTGAFAYNALRSVCLSGGAPERLGWCRWIRTRFWRPAPLRRIHWRGQERQVWERRSLFVRPKHLDLSVQERPDRLPPRNRSGLVIEAR